MYPKFGFFRRFAEDLQQTAKLVAFDIDIVLDLSEADIVEQLEARAGGLGAAG